MTGQEMQTEREMPILPSGERVFIGQMTAFSYFGSLEDAGEAWTTVLGCARDHGFELLSGSMQNASEREVDEHLSFGSTAPFRNTRAQARKEGMTGDTSTSKAGATTGATR